MPAPVWAGAFFPGELFPDDPECQPSCCPHCPRATLRFKHQWAECPPPMPSLTWPTRAFHLLCPLPESLFLHILINSGKGGLERGLTSHSALQQTQPDSEFNLSLTWTPHSQRMLSLTILWLLLLSVPSQTSLCSQNPLSVVFFFLANFFLF